MNTEQFDGHTPGPWNTRPLDPNAQTEWAAVTSTGDWILRVAEDNKGWPLSRADARLIAAAPDLLAALIEERKMHERLREVVADAHFLIRDRCTTETPFAYLRIAHMLQQALHGSEGEPLHGGEEE